MTKLDDLFSSISNLSIKVDFTLSDQIWWKQSFGNAYSSEATFLKRPKRAITETKIIHRNMLETKQRNSIFIDVGVILPECKTAATTLQCERKDSWN